MLFPIVSTFKSPFSSSSLPPPKLHLTNGDPLPNRLLYRQLVGKLLYLSLPRCDISYNVHHLSHFFLLPKHHIIMRLYIIFIMFNVLLPLASFTLCKPIFSSLVSLMRIGLLVSILKDPFLTIIYSLAMPLFSGNPS